MPSAGIAEGWDVHIPDTLPGGSLPSNNPCGKANREPKRKHALRVSWHWPLRTRHARVSLLVAPYQQDVRCVLPPVGRSVATNNSTFPQRQPRLRPAEHREVNPWGGRDRHDEEPRQPPRPRASVGLRGAFGMPAASEAQEPLLVAASVAGAAAVGATHDPVSRFARSVTAAHSGQIQTSHRRGLAGWASPSTARSHPSPFGSRVRPLHSDTAQCQRG